MSELYGAVCDIKRSIDEWRRFHSGQLWGLNSLANASDRTSVFDQLLLRKLAHTKCTVAVTTDVLVYKVSFGIYFIPVRMRGVGQLYHFLHTLAVNRGR